MQLSEKVACTFVSYEAVRCKSYLSSIPYSVIVKKYFDKKMIKIPQNVNSIFMHMK